MNDAAGGRAEGYRAYRAPACEIHVPIAPTPAFFSGVRFLAESVRRWAGPLADSRIVVTISRDREPFDPNRRFAWSEPLGLAWRWVDPERYRRFGLAATALERFAQAFEAPFVLMLDADVLCTGDLGDLPELAGDGVAGVIAHVSPAASLIAQRDVPRTDHGLWPDLFSFAGLPEPELAHEHTGWGLLDEDPERRRCPPYFNMGSICGPSLAMSALGDIVFEELATVQRYGHSYFWPQLALSLAIARAGVAAAELPMRFNFPNDERFRLRFASDAEDVRLLHYLRRHEVDRDEFLAGPDDFARFLGRRELTSLNALLRSRLDELARERGEDAHEWPGPRSLAPRFPFVRPTLPRPREWAPFLTASYRANRFANRGPLVRRLEAELGEFIGDGEREPVLVSNGTSGLVGSLLALEVHGRVAMPAFTFPATAHAVELAGCTPVLCEIDPDSWELSPEALEALVAESDCAAVVHVRPLGLCRQIDAIEAIAARAGIPLVLDSAAAFGGREPNGAPVGRSGSLEVFSFHATKPFAVGEGGVVLAPPRLAERIRRAINFGIAASDVRGRGLNAKMSEFTAAVGLAMLRRFERDLAARRATASRLLEIGAASGTARPPLDPGLPPWQCTPITVLERDARDPLIRALAGRGIDARTYYAPGLHRTRRFRRGALQLTATDDVCERIVCLPTYADLSSSDSDAFISRVQASLAETAPVAAGR